MVIGLDHLQIAMPRGEEAAARAFYVSLLGLAEEDKPEVLRARGGLWLRAGATGVHLGVEEPFRPAGKAHPAFVVPDLAAALARLRAAGCALKEDVPLPGVIRAFVADPFGNRVELVQQVAEG